MDYYSTLGVPKTATAEEIKRAYKKLAMLHHPDRNDGVDTQFKKIQEAYETLYDPIKRQQYDNPVNSGNFRFGFSTDPELDSIFSQMFGDTRQQRPTYRTTVTVSLVDAYKGSNHVLQVSTPQGNKVINITVPPGVETGDSVRYNTVIDNSILIVQFAVLKDLRFDRRGKDLFFSHSVSVLDLIVGTKFKFNTIDQRTLEVKITPHTQPNTQLRIPSAGMPDKSGGFGDQIILLNPYTPDNISIEIKNAINEFKKTDSQ